LVTRAAPRRNRLAPSPTNALKTAILIRGWRSVEHAAAPIAPRTGPQMTARARVAMTFAATAQDTAHTIHGGRRLGRAGLIPRWYPG
jgi:hypothetical protein